MFHMKHSNTPSISLKSKPFIKKQIINNVPRETRNCNSHSPTLHYLISYFKLIVSHET